MQIDISSMLRGEVSRIDETDAPEGFRDVHFPKTIKISGYITDSAGYMALVADTEVPFTTHCARCAEAIETVLPLHFERTLALKLENEDNDDYILIKHNKVDLDDEICEELLFEIDFAYYCSEDCKGLCPVCGKNLNQGPCGCSTKEIDPRLANLAKLLDN